MKTHVGIQKAIEKNQLKRLKTYSKLKYDVKKELIREGIPDSHKRDVILAMFDLDPRRCFFDYQAIKESMSQEFLNYTDQVRMAA